MSVTSRSNVEIRESLFPLSFLLSRINMVPNEQSPLLQNGRAHNGGGGDDNHQVNQITRTDDMG